MKNRNLFLLCFSCLIFPSLAREPEVCSDGNCIQVGSYNIELLGKSRSGRDRRTKDEVQKIAETIAGDIDLEVVVLQEINTDSRQWSWLKDDLASRGYKFFEGTTSERKQFVVLAWDGTQVSLNGTTTELDVPVAYTDPEIPTCTYEGLRKPVAGKFTAGAFDFWVIGVHLKSQSRRGIPDDCPDWIRTQQAKDLLAAVSHLTAGDPTEDVLIVGDFNERHDHESLLPFKQAGFISQMNYRMEGAGTVSYIKSRQWEKLIDHVMYNVEDRSELVRNSGFVMPKPDDIRAYIDSFSDHVPVWASFRTDQDLD